jgi:type I restriction enzyme M protein
MVKNITKKPTVSYEQELWDAANKLRASSSLKTTEFSNPVLGLIFLKYADYKFNEGRKQLAKTASSRRSSLSEKDRFHDKGILYLPEKARFSYLLTLPEGENISKAVNGAMSLIEQENLTVLDGVLPKNYQRLGNSILKGLLKQFNAIDMSKIEGDAFGKIYEFFLGKFASAEGQRGGEFFTPTTLVQLIVEILKPMQGNIYDPACGSGGMFVQSSEFIKRNKGVPNEKIVIYGQEKTEETVKLCKMNLAVHGLEGHIHTGNTMETDLMSETDLGTSIGKMNFVMANPPFNVSGIDKKKLEKDKRYKFGIPKVDNANYLWIQCFYSALAKEGRAGFVMPNSASDARQSEQIIRAKMIKEGVVDIMVSVGSNFFHNVTLPCTLWFFDKGKIHTARKNKILFLDIKEIYTSIDRAHNEFSEEQIEYVANIAKLYRGEIPTFNYYDRQKFLKQFPNLKYKDINGLCKSTDVSEIEAQTWSLNPGRYVGIAKVKEEGYVFKDKIKELNAEFKKLNSEAKVLEEKINSNIRKILRV